MKVNEMIHLLDAKLISGSPELEAVSYTHLDVYKRQAQTIWMIRTAVAPC